MGSLSVPTEAVLEKKSPHSTLTNNDSGKQTHVDAEKLVVDSTSEGESSRRHSFVRIASLVGLALFILGWWISSIILQATRHRWVVQTFFAWAFILIIAFYFIPNSVTRPFEAVWFSLIEGPFFRIPKYVRFTLGWLSLIAIIFGSAFGFKLENGTKYGDRAISVLGLVVFQFGFWATSRNRSAIQWRTVIIGLFIQQVIALFVLKSSAGFHTFDWLANLAADFLNQGLIGAAFFFDVDTVNTKHWFFVNVFPTIIFFNAFIQVLYHFGVMQWVIKSFAWFFYKTMNVSGAEAVVASASPFVGQGESACLVRPFIEVMTESEIHLIMTSGFSTIAGALLSLYMSLGVPAQTLITASMMSIPASMAISKIRMPEVEEPVTRGRVVVDLGDDPKDAPVSALQALGKGAVLGLFVSGQILCNVIAILAFIGTINGLLTWIGRGFGIHQMTLQLGVRYVFYPLAFLTGVPRAEVMRVAELLATKLIENEIVAYSELQVMMASSDPLSKRGFTIVSYALCSFANLSSLGIQIGVLSALAPSRTHDIARVGPSAIICGFISTLQTAGIAGMLV